MPEMMLPDGTYKEVSWDEIRERSGEEAVRDMQAPLIKRSEMTEGEKYLADKMQLEAEVNHALYEAGIESLDDLPREPATRETLNDPSHEAPARESLDDPPREWDDN